MKKGAVFFAVLALVGLLGYGIVHLFAIRFALGDIYAPYSSLRADGLGTKALHDSLAELMPVERNLMPLSKLTPDSGAAIFIIGASRNTVLPGRGLDDLQVLLHGGSRVVVAFYPADAKPKKDEEETDTPRKHKKKTAGAREKEKGDKAAEDEADEQLPTDWQKLWGLKADYFGHSPDHARAQAENLEAQVSWHTAFYFDKLEPDWETLYVARGKPVIIRRQVGRGTLILMADSYLLSNEALGKERAPQLLAALPGATGRIIFEESHLGMHLQPGVASLVRKYRLHGIVIALLIVAGLFVWRNSVPFIPPRDEYSGDGEIVQGRDAASGFVSMLKRSIPRRDLLRTCVNEWKRSLGHRAAPALLAHVDAALAAGTPPVETFQTITQTLTQKK